jgi:hypothetical protein
LQDKVLLRSTNRAQDDTDITKHDEDKDQDNENDEDSADNEVDEIFCFSNDPEHRVSGMVSDKAFTPSTTGLTCPVYRRTLWAT